MKKFFDKWEFDNAIKQYSTNPKETKIRLENYTRKYPKDYSAYHFYAITLIKLGLDKEAEQIIKYQEKEISKEKDIDNKLNYLNKGILFAKIKLLSYQEKYRELYKLYVNNIDNLGNIDIESLMFYTRKNLGLLAGENRNNYYYLQRQIIEYREEDFLEKLKNYSYEYNQKTNNTSGNIFREDFPFQEVINEVKNYLLLVPYTYNSFVEDTYVFKYDNCGTSDNIMQNYFKVFCFHNTRNIIIMYPAKDCENLDYIDLNYLNHGKKNTNIKKLSQTEKFNKRYNKKN